MQNKIGIVVVTYNASSVVRATLASLRMAKNRTPFEVVVVDNSSVRSERKIIRHAVERHVREAGLPWRYIQTKKNLGFSGGNNVGFEEFLKDDSITHICMLNSDVIVLDYWLDRLVQNKFEIVSPVTNKSESIQVVPTDYELEFDDCFNINSDSLYPDAYKKLNRFSQEWHRAWQGNNLVTDQEVTFFCALITRDAILKVGLLDPVFFPGGYEDFDYCARVRTVGGKVCIVRDVYMHHWGSASFGQLSREYFDKNAIRNKCYLEEKHNIIWERSPQAPIISFSQDLSYLLMGKGERALQLRFIDLYLKSVSDMVEHYCKESMALQKELRIGWRGIPADLKDIRLRAGIQDDLLFDWSEAVIEISHALDIKTDESPNVSEIIPKLNIIAIGIRTIALNNIKTSDFLYKTPLSKPLPQEGLLIARKIKKVLKGVAFFWHLRGIVFFGGYPYPERLNDGYFQRIKSIDDLFTEVWRIYIDKEILPGRATWYDFPAPKTLVLRLFGYRIHKLLATCCMVLSVLRTGTLYFHSVLPMKYYGAFLKIPGIKKIIDIHGAVPEEFRYHGDNLNADYYEQWERVAVKKADYLVVVTDTMEHHINKKYQDVFHGKFILLPIFPDIPINKSTKHYQDGKPMVVYAGGMQKWQQISKMLDAVRDTIHDVNYQIFCPEPLELRKLLSRKLIHAYDLEIGSKTSDELLEIYKKCHYGFILREDIIVNQVACPTKLVEYIATGIVPIVDSENIGDFTSLGMKSIHLEELVRKQLPEEKARKKMAEINLQVYEKLKSNHRDGVVALQQAVKSKNRARCEVVRNPHHDSLQVIRGNTKVGLESDGINELLGCDILVQVDNFLSGGLENLVLDTNQAFREAGYRVGMLVFGDTGLALEKARQSGFPVFVTNYEPQAYERILSGIQPKLLLSHYSTRGAKYSAKLEVPLIQMIHNIYMWFTPEQLKEFQVAAGYTDAFITNSEFTTRYSVERLGIPSKKCRFIPFGIELEKIKGLDFPKVRKEMRENLGISEKDFVFLSVGAVNHQKNLISAVKAFHLASKRCLGGKLILVGPGYEKELLEQITQYITRNNLSDSIIYVGESSEVQSFYAMADAFVCCSFFEGGPLVLLEALAANLPIVTTEVGLAALFRDRKGVAVVPPPVDIINYHGTISELRSTPDFERELASKMILTYENPVQPNLSKSCIEMMDKQHAYRNYVKFIRQIIEKGTLTPGTDIQSWVDKIND